MSDKPRVKAWIPATPDAPTIYAVQAVYAGEADASQQRMALEWIIHSAAQTYDEPYRSDADGGERETSFALGRAYVGRQIVKLVNMPGEIMDGIRKTDG